MTMDIPEGSEEAALHVDSWVIDSLGEISVPVLVIVGERDNPFAARIAVFEKYLDVKELILDLTTDEYVIKQLNKTSMISYLMYE